MTIVAAIICFFLACLLALSVTVLGPAVFLALVIVSLTIAVVINLIQQARR